MTQIKLRRDTSANFTSANPILGNGEPAYETDTKKLKIGDGTTAYTQLEYFSAGGGSTDISATLPLKIVDGVISLEVDGQTIQIVDGKLHANLDELSNTVNTLSDDVGTSFDLINILQTDVQSNTESITNLQNALSKKENTITAIAPLGLREYIKDTLKGFTYTTDGQSIYQNAIEGSAGIASDYSSLYARPSRSVSTTNDLFLSYIDIPFTFGKVYTIGQKKSSSSYHEEGSFVLGKTLADGTFIPILWEYSDVRITTSDTYREVNQHITFDTISGGSLSFNGGTSQESGISSGWLQLIKTNTGVLYNRSRPSSNYPSNHLQLNITNTTAIARLDECDTLRLVPSATDWYAWGGSAASAVPVSQIGMYSYSGTAAGNITWEQLGTNEFQIGAAVSHNYLELSLGSGLSVVDGKLTSTGGSTGGITIDDVSPDYTAGVDVSGYTTSSNQFTAPSAGIIYFFAGMGGGTDARPKIYINDVLFSDLYAIGSTSTFSVNNGEQFVLGKGDKYYATFVVTGYATGANMFYPLKGANK